MKSKILLLISCLILIGMSKTADAVDCNDASTIDNLIGDFKTAGVLKTECMGHLKQISTFTEECQQKLFENISTEADSCFNLVDLEDCLKRDVELKAEAQALSTTEDVLESQQPLPTCCKAAKELVDDTIEATSPEEECSNHATDSVVPTQKMAKGLKCASLIFLTSVRGALFQPISVLATDAVVDSTTNCIKYVLPNEKEKESIIECRNTATDAQAEFDSSVIEKTNNCLNKMTVLSKCATKDITDVADISETTTTTTAEGKF